jgi:hypothetical protein
MEKKLGLMEYKLAKSVHKLGLRESNLGLFQYKSAKSGGSKSDGSLGLMGSNLGLFQYKSAKSDGSLGLMEHLDGSQQTKLKREYPRVVHYNHDPVKKTVKLRNKKLKSCRVLCSMTDSSFCSMNKEQS